MASTSAEMNVVTLNMRLEGTKASSTQRRRRRPVTPIERPRDGSASAGTGERQRSTAHASVNASSSR